MLNIKAKTSIKGQKFGVIQDPWDSTSPSSSSIVSPSTLEPFTIERKPLIGSAGSPNAIPLAPGKFPPEPSLLWYWLKLKTLHKELGTKLQQALGLLYWLEGQA